MSEEPGPRASVCLVAAAAARARRRRGARGAASRRPPLPPLLAPLKPTAGEEIRGTLVLIAWLLLVVICLAVAWRALRPTARRAAGGAESSLRLCPPGQAATAALPASLARAARRCSRATTRPPNATGRAEQDEPISDASAQARPDDDDRPEAEAPRMLRLYGPLSIDGSDGVGLGQRPTRGLIAYLALKRGPASSDELLEALWPGQPPASTRSRLWKAKHQARSSSATPCNDGRAATCSTAECSAATATRSSDSNTATPSSTRIERALALIGGEPLARHRLPLGRHRAPPAASAESRHARQGRRRRLEDGDANGALTAAERLIELDLLNEQGWRLAMEAEAALGQRQAILDRYQALSRELDERLGLRPASRDERQLPPSPRPGVNRVAPAVPLFWALRPPIFPALREQVSETPEGCDRVNRALAARRIA